MSLRSRALAAAAAILLGCATEPGSDPADAGCDGGKCDASDDGYGDRSVCVALRGNGDRIFALITGVARVIEHYGLLQGAAGGSSASITSFFVESVHANPLLRDCGGEQCSDDEAAARAALLLKSTQGYFEVLRRSDEALAFQTLAPLAERIQAAGLPALLESDPAAAQAALTELLTSEDLRDLVNEEVLATIAASPDPAFHVRDFVETAGSFGQFEVRDESVLLRPGFVDFEKTAEKIGRIGSFLAADEPVDREAMRSFLEHCATPGRGSNWPEVAQLRAGDSTCGEALVAIAESFRDAVTAEGADFPSRIDATMGEGFHAIVATSVLTGDAVRTWQAARDDYRHAREWEFEVDFEDVAFGYFGSEADLAAIDYNAHNYDDAKTRKAIGLGAVTWREALTFSPAEPGIARALEIDDEHVSAGGWPDLHPVLVLKNAGCDEVVYVTRRGGESDFALRMADTALDAEPEQVAELYDLDRGAGYGLSLAEADAVLCTDWNEQPALDLPIITGHVWRDSPLVTDDPFFTESENADPNITEVGAAPLGCAPARSPASGG